MKRTPLKRGNSQLKRTPLKRGSATLKQTPLKQGTSNGLKRSSIKPKPRTITPEERQARATVKKRSDGVCEICNQNQATDMAHRLARSASGKWEACNLLHACRSCHDYNHANPLEAYEKGQHLRAGSDPHTSPVLCYNNGVQGNWILTNSGSVSEVHFD